MGKAIDITNQKFGKITALYDTGIRKNRQALWHCICDCGNECDVLGNSLRSGHTTSCGCKWKESKVENLIGQKFNQLTVLEREGSNERRHALWKCRCDCGNPNPIFISSSSLKNGNTKSCGCLKNTSIGEEKIANILIENNIKFKKQFTFPDLFSPKGALLRFDFGIYNDIGTLKYLIEYDGIQHYTPVEYFGGEEAFKYLQECDKIKNEYCKNWNIPLIRISYLNENITIGDLIYDDI